MTTAMRDCGHVGYKDKEDMAFTLRKLTVPCNCAGDFLCPDLHLTMSSFCKQGAILAFTGWSMILTLLFLSRMKSSKQECFQFHMVPLFTVLGLVSVRFSKTARHPGAFSLSPRLTENAPTPAITHAHAMDLLRLQE